MRLLPWLGFSIFSLIVVLMITGYLTDTDFLYYMLVVIFSVVMTIYTRYHG